MHILLITDSYAPEVRSASLMMAELARGLSRNGHRVSVVTSIPKYNLVEGQTPLNRLFIREEDKGIQIYRFQTPPLHNVSHLKRGFGQMILPAIFSLVLFFIGRIDISIVYSPPLTLGLTACLLKWMRGAVYIFNVQDLFPQNAIDLQALKNSVLITFFRKLERCIYRQARFITVHSPANMSYIAELGISPEKIKVIPNWVDLETFSGTGQSYPLKAGLEGKFIVLFAGVMSYAQDMRIIIETARLLKGQRDIVFLLAGDGSQKQTLAGLKIKFSLTNLILHPFIPLERYPELVAQCAVGLVTLKKCMTTPVVPSKILGYMAAGKPVIGSLNQKSEANDIIEAAGCGWAKEINGPEDMAEAICKLYENPALKEAMGRNGREYISKNFTLKKSLAAYERLFIKCNI